MDKRGYYQKYNIERADGKPVDEFTFVLEGHDPYAIPALKAYAQACARVNPTLAADLGTKIDELVRRSVDD